MSGVQSHMVAWAHPTLWRDDKWPCCAQPLCRGLAMNVHVVRNPMFWYGHAPRYGAVINGW